MRAIKLKTAILLAGYLILIGCTSETPTPTSTAEPTSTATIPPSPTVSPTASRTPVLTLVPPSETPYPTPETPLDPDGPWLIFPAALTNSKVRYPLPYLWAMNADGTGLTLLDSEPVETYTLRPDNTQDSRSTLVYITSKPNAYRDLTLKSITLPDLEKTTITPLIGPDVVDFNGDPLLALYYGWYLWSSDGNTLVFVGLMDRQWSDIYTYDFTTKAITRLTGDDYLDYDESDEEGFYGNQGNACCLQWSPDERYVIYKPFQAEFGGSDTPFPLGLAAARVSGERDFTMINMSAGFRVFGWYSPDEILLQDKGLADWDPAGGIYAFNLDTGESTTIIDEVVSNAAYAEEHDTWLYTLGEDQPLILFRDGITTEVYNPGLSSYDYLRWSDEDNAFIAGSRYMITLDGRVSQTVRTPTPDPSSWAGVFEPRLVESPDGTLWAWADFCYTADARFRDLSCGLWVGAPNSVPSEIFANPENYVKPDRILLDSITWSPDSQRLIYTTDHGLFMSERPDFEPVLLADIYGYQWKRQYMIWAGK